jgi:hypothetical protein
MRTRRAANGFLELGWSLRLRKRFDGRLEEGVGSAGESPSMRALFRPDGTMEQTMPLLELWETFGPALIDRIAAAYRERSFS